MTNDIKVPTIPMNTFAGVFNYFLSFQNIVLDNIANARTTSSSEESRI